jgi:hypothetical protein
MLIDVLMLFASAGLGVAATECREWAQCKAGERNHDIEQALLKAHQRSLKDICTYCQKSPEWDRYHPPIITRVKKINTDFKQILTIVQEGEPEGVEGSLQLPQQQAIAQNLRDSL